MLMSSLATSIANVALPALAQAFQASFQQVQWIVLAYLLAVTTLVVSVGRLGDVVGRRRLLLTGIALFTVASLLCGLAPTLPLLVAARVAQGLGAATMMVLAMAFVGEAVPQDRRGSAMGLLGTVSAVGTALGPTLGGALIATLGWPALFHAFVPLGFIAFVLVHRFLPVDRRSGQPGGAHFDVIGTLLLASTLAAYALAMTMGRGRFGQTHALLLCLAVVGTGLFLIAESKVSHPLVRLAMFRQPGLGAGFATSLLVTTVVMTTLVVGPFYLSRTLHLGPGQVGLVMSCGPIAAAFAGVPAGRAVDRHGAARMAAAGLAAMFVGCLSLAGAPSSWAAPAYVVPLVVMTAGYALFQAANNTAVLTNVPAEQRGLMSGLLNLSRHLGLITGASAMGAVFTQGTAAGDLATADPQAVAQGMHTTFAVAALLIGLALCIAHWPSPSRHPRV
ncbi:MAG: MFS transporter [Rubrivivax sp.]|nr:MAG: MFS transporter [Rubrivivax sp.]